MGNIICCGILIFDTVLLSLALYMDYKVLIVGGKHDTQSV